MGNNVKRKIGLALGSGSARGWSHIGVIQELENLGIRPDIICGTSIGSLVGAFYSAGKLPALESWVESLEWKDILGFMDWTFGGGLIRGKKLFDFFAQEFRDAEIHELTLPYGAVAADLDTGIEVWIRDGSIFEAVRASISLPGIFTPVLKDGRWLVDGGLVNPVPVSLCRAMGADYVIAVDLNQDLLEKREEEDKKEISTDQMSRWRSWTSKFWGSDLDERLKDEKDEKPGIMEVVSKSINIMQIRITRSRMAGDPPDILLAPRLRYIGLMEFHRGKEAIAEGRDIVRKMAPALIIPK
ncbi:NTE family protein RssA [Leptospira inadai serovar Lyme str. 10]|uniref:NTE family protein RssA n=2 Tax=Leptospira inadai serovar Lyme TaxID=293084 RepID=V6H8I0_9LEPT|nr:patatin-like phospholipase RssA [Leptospira inadai]EQA35231.1 NTE family protein RssA [Leptospira inadai serovar Lyme str. 10]PNV72439.1 patatin [Leptospira inadai serovar Lyme]